MKISRKKIALFAGLALTGSTILQPIHPAYAVWATSLDVWTSYAKNIIEQAANKADILSNVGGWITQAYNGLSNSVLSQSGQQTQNTTAQIKAQANMEDTKAQFDYQNNVAREVLKAENESMSGSNNCAAITGRMQGAYLEEYVRALRAKMSSQANALSSGFDVSNPNRYMSPLDIQRAYQRQHCLHDATELDVNMGICQAVTATAGRNNAVVDTQGQPHVMVPNDQNADVFLNNPTLSQQETEASQRFTMLVADPHPSGQILPRLGGSTSDRMAQMYEWDRQRAIRSVAKSVISRLVAEGTVIDPNSDQQKKLQAWAENRAQTVAGYVPDGNGKYFPNGVSDLAFNDLMARGFENDLNASIIGSSQNSSASLKDILQILQFQTHLLWMIYLQNRDRTMVEATRLSISADQEERNNEHTANAAK